jgi:hypothetical protein
MAIGMAGRNIWPRVRRGASIPVLIKSGIVEQASGFSCEELSKILAWLLEFDTGFKTGKFEPTEQALQLLCYKIIRIRTLDRRTGRSREILLPGRIRRYRLWRLAAPEKHAEHPGRARTTRLQPSFAVPAG